MGDVLVGFCADTAHPTLAGRALVRWSTHGNTPRTEGAWLPSLQGLSLRAGDRILLVRPANFDEPVIIGILDGFSRRPVLPTTSGARITVKPDECLTIETVDAEPILRVSHREGGPVISLLTEDARVGTPGSLTFDASAIRFHAHQGEISLIAADDVDIQGEIINLNSADPDTDAG